MSFTYLNRDEQLITARHVRTIAKLTSLKHLEFEAFNDTISDSDLASLTGLSRLQSLSVALETLKVEGQELQALSKLTGLSALNLTLRWGPRHESEYLVVVTSLAACPALKDINLTIKWSDQHIWPDLLQAVAAHLNSVLTSLHMDYNIDPPIPSHLVVGSHLTLLAQLTTLKSLGISDRKGRWDDLSPLSALSALRRLQSFSLLLSTSNCNRSMDKVAVDLLCSSWGGQLTHLCLVNLGASASHDLAWGMRSLRSLAIDPRLPRMLARLRPSCSQPPSSHLCTALTSLDLWNTTLRCFHDDWTRSDVALAIQTFVNAFLLPQQTDDKMVAGQASEACQAVAGALYVCAKAVTEAGGTFPADILVRLEEAAACSRGVRAAAPHLLQCTHLRHLSLHKCEIKPAELVALLLSCPELESLTLRDVDSVGAAHVAVMGQLKQLGCITLRQVKRLDGTRTSPEDLPVGCLRCLASLPELRMLNVNKAALHTANLGGAAWDALKGMRRLYELNCTGCRDEDAIIDALRCLPHADMSNLPLAETDFYESYAYDSVDEYDGYESYDDAWDEFGGSDGSEYSY